MSELIQVDDVDLEQVEIEGTDYVYPVPRMDLAHIKLVSELSSAHAVGNIVALEADPEKYPAQGAYWIANEPQDLDFIVNTASLVKPDFKDTLERTLADEHTRSSFEWMGEHLEQGGNYIHAVPHGSISDIGLEHALMYAALASLGFKFRAGAVISEGVTTLGHEFRGAVVPAPQALVWAAHKMWLVIPRTKKVEESKFSEVVSDNQIGQQNRVVRSDIGSELDEGGTVITVAPSATSYMVDRETGVHWLAAPTLGTLKTMAHPNTYTHIAVGKIQDQDPSVYGLWGEPRQLSGSDEELEVAGYELMDDMTAGLNEMLPDMQFAFADPRKLGTKALQGMREG